MAKSMALVLTLSLFLSMHMGDVQATHCPSSGCPADDTDDVELIQKRVAVEAPLEKEGAMNETCPSPLHLSIRTSSWGHENSWSIAGCYLSGAGRPCAGGGSPRYGDHRTYYASCCCPGKTVVELTCSCSYGDGWHGGFVNVQEVGQLYCRNFLSGYSKSEYLMVGTTTNTTASGMCFDGLKIIRGRAVPPSSGGALSSPDISGTYGTTLEGLPHRAFLSQTGCAGVWSFNRNGSLVTYPYYVFGRQVTLAYQLFGNITGMPGTYKLTFDLMGGTTVFTQNLYSNASSNASFNAALLEQGAVERFEELLLKLETLGQSSPEEGESHARIHSQRASDDDDDDDDEDRTVMTNIAKNSAS